MSTLALLGRGWRFPIQPLSDGNLSYTSGPDLVRQSIWVILDTEPGERVMRPTFGCGLRRYLMRPNTVATRTLIERDVESALALWEPRIELQRVSADSSEDDPALVLLRIDYVHLRDNRPGSLVYPFYLE